MINQLIEICLNHIINSTTWHQNAFFDEKWNVKSARYTFGHDIETSWLLCEAAEALEDIKILEMVKSVAANMARVTYEQGIDSDGSLLYEAGEKGVTDSNREWWPQAEAVVGFLNAYQLTGKEKYYHASYRCWKYIEEKLVDKVDGEWFWGRDPKGRILDKDRVELWKCPYHNGRMCMEVIERIKRI